MSDGSTKAWRAEPLVAARNVLGESALWDPRSETIYWLDLLEPALNCASLDGNTFRKLTLQLRPPLGMIALTDDPDFLFLATRGGLHLLYAHDGTVRPLGDPSEGQSDIVFNDGKIDRSGRLWLGTSHELETEPKGSLYMREKDGSFRVADSGFAVSNGPAFSRDGTILYFSDSARARILAYDMPSAGLPLSNRRIFATFDDDEGVPDGLTVDAEDCLWCAHWGGSRVTHFAADGTRIGHVELPVPLVTSCTFAGPGLETLIITTARSSDPTGVHGTRAGEGDLYRCRPGVRGLP